MSATGKDSGQHSSPQEGTTSSTGGDNRRLDSRAPRYKGVRMREWGSWVAEVRVPNSRERVWLGSHDTAEKAARAYDAAVLCLRGPQALFNFPDSLPSDLPLAGGSHLTREQIQEVAARHARGEAAPARDVQPAERAEEGGIVGAGERMFEWPEDPLAGFPSPEWTMNYDEEVSNSSPEDSGGEGCCLWSFSSGDAPPSGTS